MTYLENPTVSYHQVRESSGSVVECLMSLGCVLDQDTLIPSLVLVQPRKTRPYITERLLMGCKESNQNYHKVITFQGCVQWGCPDHQRLYEGCYCDKSWLAVWAGSRLLPVWNCKYQHGPRIPHDIPFYPTLTLMIDSYSILIICCLVLHYQHFTTSKTLLGHILTNFRKCYSHIY